MTMELTKATAGTADSMAVRAVYAPSHAGGQPMRCVTLTLPNRPGLCLLSILQAIRRELQLHNRFGLACHMPRNAIARAAFRLAQKPDARARFGAQRGDFCQISIATLAFQAGWKFRPFARLSQSDSV